MKKVKHDHKGTKALKLGIFASMMLAPLLAIAFKCAYVTFNKNAKDSYSDKNTIVETKVDFTNFTNIINNNYYYLDTSSVDAEASYNSASYKIEYSNLTGINAPANATSFTIGASIGHSDKWSFSFYDSNNQYLSAIQLRNINTRQFSFIIVNSFTDAQAYFTNSTIGAILSTYTYIQDTNSLDNAFYYAVDEMKNNELFNWTTTTALYTPTSAMTTGMGITTTALPILITYWLYLTAIYIVIDIVIELFTYLTHMITSRFEQ